MQKPLKILQASAGSGKTFSLAAHYLTLLFDSESKYREILAVTFTNKATEEMKTRILHVLQGMARNNPKVADYKKIIQNAHPQLNDELLQSKADRIYRKILHDYSRFSVSTIDGFVQKVIRGFTFELGLSADYILELNTEKVKTELIEKLDEQLSSEPDLRNWVIKLALGKIEDGKNWNYKTELKEIVNEIFKESFETFENSVQQFSAASIQQLFNTYADITKHTIQSYNNALIQKVQQACQIVAKSDIEPTDLIQGSRSRLLKIEKITNNDDESEKIFALIDQPERWFKEGKNNTALYQQLNPILKEIKIFQEEHIGNFMLAEAFSQNLYHLKLILDIVQLLSEYRNENGNLLISDAQKLVTGITNDVGADPSFIWEKVGHRYRNFLFDEFQDTSIRQWKSFRVLLSNALSTTIPSKHASSHLIVGDTKQSIYRWRAGDWNILHHQAQQDVNPDNVSESSLKENYRSSKNIIDFNNHLYQHVPSLLQNSLNEHINTQTTSIKEWWQHKQYDNMITEVYSNAWQDSAPTTPEGGYIKIQQTDGDKKDEKGNALTNVIQEIHQLVHQYHYQYGDIALLVRSNHEAALCVHQLMLANYPVLSGDALLIANSPAISLTINTLKVLAEPDEQVAICKANCIALYHSIHHKMVDPSWYIGIEKKSLAHLHHALPLTLCCNWKNWLQLPLAEIVENIYESYELTNMAAHVPFLLAFRDQIGRATQLGEKGIAAFLEWWGQDGCAEALPSPEGANAIQIITIHKSKGLAFKAVFIPFCNWSIKPIPNSIFWVSAAGTPYEKLGNIPLKFTSSLAKSSVCKSYLEELMYGYMDSLNMLYVATTRAINFLYIATSKQPEKSNISQVGHLINKFIEQINRKDASTLTYESGHIITQDKKTDAPTTFKLTRYPTSNRLAKLYGAVNEKEISHLPHNNKARERSIAHDILAHATNELEINEYIGQILSQGIIKQTECAHLQQIVMNVLAHPQIHQLFQAHSQSIAEKNIIDTDGKLQRPDRIFIDKNDNVVLLDYKFTSEQKSSHHQQLLRYKALLQQMGYNKIDAYLFYTESGTLKMVNQ